MKRLIPLSLSIVFCLVFAVDAFSQCSNENNLWQAIVEQRDERRRVEQLESFIRSCSNSPNRPDADKRLVDSWLKSNDHKKIMDHADNFQQSLPSADAPSKATVYTQAMLSAYTMSNLPKTNEFGGLALSADPNSFMVLQFLASTGILDPAKTLEYAEKAVTLPQPTTMPEAQYRTAMARMEGVVANSLASQNKFKEAIPHYEKALQLNPKDHGNQFRHGMTTMQLMAAAVQGAKNASDEVMRAMGREPKVQADIDKATAEIDESSKAALALRDRAMDSFAKAFAIGGQFAEQAKTVLDNLYTNKNKSLEGIDAFIAAKKTELGQ